MSYCQLKYRATESDKLRRDPGYCNICKKTEGELKRCAACQEVDYCSIECQRADWKEHKYVIKFMYLWAVCAYDVWATIVQIWVSPDSEATQNG